MVEISSENSITITYQDNYRSIQSSVIPLYHECEQKEESINCFDHFFNSYHHHSIQMNPDPDSLDSNHPHYNNQMNPVESHNSNHHYYHYRIGYIKVDLHKVNDKKVREWNL